MFRQVIIFCDFSGLTGLWQFFWGFLYSCVMPGLKSFWGLDELDIQQGIFTQMSGGGNMAGTTKG